MLACFAIFLLIVMLCLVNFLLYIINNSYMKFINKIDQIKDGVQLYDHGDVHVMLWQFAAGSSFSSYCFKGHAVITQTVVLDTI